LNIISYIKRYLIFNFKSKKKLIKLKNFKNLDELFRFYNTDKSSNYHGFAKFYEKFFHEYKYKKINLMEIGSAQGGSAAAFNSYFDNCKIYCFDNHIENFLYKSNFITPILIDCSNSKSLKKIYQKFKNKNIYFDIIIDDGSHRLDDIILSLKHHFRKLKKNGLYIIEDFMHPNYYKHCENNSKEIKINQLIKNIKKKTKFESTILTKADQEYMFSKVDKIITFKGLRKDSDICFIKKK